MTATQEHPRFGTKHVLSGARSYVADAVRHFLALFISVVIASIPFWGGEVLSEWSVSVLLGWGWIIAELAVASLLGHVLVTRLRGFVSLPMSAFLTWLALLALSTVSMLGADFEMIAATLLYSVFICTPIVLLALGLRLLIPGLRIHVNGRPVRVRMSSSSL